jgi:hypothetical protein
MQTALLHPIVPGVWATVDHVASRGLHASLREVGFVGREIGRGMSVHEGGMPTYAIPHQSLLQRKQIWLRIIHRNSIDSWLKLLA